jgi:hypothetical protein
VLYLLSTSNTAGNSANNASIDKKQFGTVLQAICGSMCNSVIHTTPPGEEKGSRGFMLNGVFDQ